jgi:hypothetical protein
MAHVGSKLISRRDLLRKTLAVGAAVAGSGALLACSKDEGLSCQDVSGLSADEQQRRTALQYTDKTPKPEQTCDNCQFYQAKAADQCGGCTILPGPVHPKGWCASWAAKQG